MIPRRLLDGALRLPPLLERVGKIVLRHPLTLALIVLPLALLLGSLAGYGFGRAGSAPPYRATRLQAVTVDLGRIEGDYLLAAGDSHIERWPTRTLCGLPLVNAGLSGATAGAYADFLAGLLLPHPPRAVILTIGTNDANTKRFSNEYEAAMRFEASFEPLLGTLRRTSRIVLVTGVPPIDTARAEGFSAQAAERIGSLAESTCKATSGCLVANPFTPGLPMIDGVHYRDYAAVYRRIGPALCAALEREHAVTASSR
jgi:lysophospholipase L1-like esterase